MTRRRVACKVLWSYPRTYRTLTRVRAWRRWRRTFRLRRRPPFVAVLHVEEVP